jgi:hypothetical protein
VIWKTILQASDIPTNKLLTIERYLLSQEYIVVDTSSNQSEAEKRKTTEGKKKHPACEAAHEKKH